MKIITNSVPRDLVYGIDLTEKERKEFDYIDADNFPCHDFLRYRGNVYDVNEFMRCNGNEFMSNWDGYSDDSYFSGIVIKFVDDNERVIVGRYYS